MAERPIRFSDAEVRAILDGRKTQTRRPLKLPHREMPNHLGYWEPSTIGGPGVVDARGEPCAEQPCMTHTRTGATVACPFGVPGDVLWVRECWANIGDKRAPRIVFRADTDGERVRVDAPWRPSIHMPRWASRISLRVTSVRGERVQDITEEDARAEGFGLIGVVVGPDGELRPDLTGTARGAFLCAWDAIYGKGDPTTPACVTQNPWVWAVSFEVIR